MTPDRLADAIADEIRGHPAVVRLDAGRHGTLVTPLKGRRVVGVRVLGPGEPVDIGVVLRMPGPFPEVAADLRVRVRRVAGDVPVNITVTDAVDPAPVGAGDQES
ncbi:hypothetical protein ACFS2C_08690 [Prauserella oleivorans]|uniref:Asp23/Gls24 family envelope stress response protein n=1 Tax=Prauserella oleivorans TaxID=1478153 RepID=A0ABW5W676_9PSEU